MKSFVKYIFFTTLFIGLGMVYGQSPTHLPRTTPEPVGFFESTENIIFYVVIPVVVVILYILWRRQLKRMRHEKEQQD